MWLRLRRVRWLGWVATFGLLLTLAGAGLAVGRFMSGGTAGADDSTGGVERLPPEGLTVSAGMAGDPDRTKPDGYGPYLLQERAAPRFRGELNGITLGVASGPVPRCEASTIASDWRAALVDTFFDMPLDRIAVALAPASLSVTLSSPPEVGVCADDGRVIWVSAVLVVQGVPGAVGGSGMVLVDRWETVRWAPQEFLADKVAPGSIANRPAVLVDACTSGFCQTAVIVADDETGGSTKLLSTNVGLDVLKMIAEAMYR